MNSKDDNLTEIQEDLKWEYAIPDPVPGLCYIEPNLKYDFKQHDNSLEDIIPPTITTNPLELFDIDYMAFALNSIENREKVGFKIRNISKGEIDYHKYIEESFDDVDNIENPNDKSIGIKEVYDVFVSPEQSKFQIIQTDGTICLEKEELFKIENCPNNNLYKIAIIGDKKYRCMKYKVSDHLLFEVEGDKIYFHHVDGIYRFTKE